VLGVPDVLERGVESVVRRVSSRSGRGCPSTARASHPAPAGGAMVAIPVVLRARAAAFRVALGPTLLRLTVSIALPATLTGRPSCFLEERIMIAAVRARTGG
jgi:hypothetical protein